MDRFAHYQWPFFDAGHAQLARDADAWAREKIAYAHGEDADAICRRLVKDLGQDSYLKHCATDKADVRTVTLLREILAYHAPLDFSIVHSFSNGATLRVRMREKVFFSHAPAVLACQRKQILIKIKFREVTDSSDLIYLI